MILRYFQPLDPGTMGHLDAATLGPLDLWTQGPWDSWTFWPFPFTTSSYFLLPPPISTSYFFLPPHTLSYGLVWGGVVVVGSDDWWVHKWRDFNVIPLALWWWVVVALQLQIQAPGLLTYPTRAKKLSILEYIGGLIVPATSTN